MTAATGDRPAGIGRGRDDATVEVDPYVGLADEASHEQAVRSRAESRQRQERAGDLATWVGALRDLAERGTAVVVGSVSGRSHRGVLVRVAADHLAVCPADGGAVVIARDAVMFVRPDPAAGAPPATGDRPAGHDRTLVEVLERRLEDRDPVVLAIRGQEWPLRGEVVGLGEDVVSLRLPDAARSVMYLPTAAIVEVGWPG